MSRILWIAAWVAAGFWSFWTWIASGLLDAVGGAARRVSGYTPGFQVEPLSAVWLVDLAHSLGGSVILFLWLAGLAVIFGGTWILSRFTSRRRGQPSQTRQTAGQLAHEIGLRFGRKLKRKLD